jgi:cell division protein FtsW
VNETPHKPDYALFGAVGALLAFGLVMVYSASFVEGYNLYGNQYHYLLRQLVGATIGGFGLYIAQRLDYNVWRRFSVQLMGLALILLILVLVLPDSMTKVNNSKSWIRFGGGLSLFSVQPSEIAKLAIIVYFADWLSRRSDKVGNVTYGLIPFGVMLGLVCGLVMLEPDLGTTMVLVMIGSIIYFAAGAKLWHVLGAAGLGAGAFYILVNFIGFRNYRIAAFIDPWKYYDSYGYQPIHALYALGSGGIFGVGLGQGRQKFQWLPQPHTDTIFAIIGEEFGLIGTLLVLAGFGVIAYRGYHIAARVRDPFAALVAVGITSWLVFQALLNLAVTTSLVPFTGLTLPFLSYGSTSLITCMVGAGLLLSISRHSSTRQLQETTDVAFSRRQPALAFLTALPLRWGNGRARLPGPGGRRSTGRNRSGGRSFRKK